MSTGKRLEVKTANYKFVTQAYRQVVRHDTPHFTVGYLSSIGVSASQAHYPSGGVEPSFKPKFFEPISNEKLADLLSEVEEVEKFPTFGLPGDFTDALSATYALNLYFQNRLQQRTTEEEFKPLLDNSPWSMLWPANTQYSQLNNFTGIQDWRVTKVFDTETPAKPHVMGIMMNQMEAKENCLLQGELMALIKLMHKRLPMRYFQEHLTFPVLIFSYTGVQHVRLLQGHVQDGKLNISFTKLYDLRTEQQDVIDLVLRYFLCHPVGDTRLSHIKE
ncbi:hypothetical protein FQN54_000542 [Arachnomyces sp. PD_36]|nr:hypothetical protein FQN54_000542 [Arachnomyces sp. PD_36]